MLTLLVILSIFFIFSLACKLLSIVVNSLIKLLNNIVRPASRLSYSALSRLKQLHVDGDLPPETAVLITAKENGLREEELLNGLNAIDAADALDIVLGRRKNLIRCMMRTIKKLKKL